MEFSLKVLIFVPTRSFGLLCCPPPFTKAGDINYTRHCAIRLFNAKAGELYVTFVKNQHMDVVTGSIRRDWSICNWWYTCNIINMNCLKKKFYSKNVSLYDKGHYMQHVMLIKLLEWRRRQVTSSNVKRRHWHKMSVSLHAGLINLQLRHCGHLGNKLIRKVCSIRIWENVIFENFVTKAPFRLTLLRYLQIKHAFEDIFKSFENIFE